MAIGLWILRLVRGPILVVKRILEKCLILVHSPFRNLSRRLTTVNANCASQCVVRLPCCLVMCRALERQDQADQVSGFMVLRKDGCH